MSAVTASPADKEQVAANRLAVASQWQLVWWAFRKHRLAMAGLIVVIALYVIAVVPGFFTVNDDGLTIPYFKGIGGFEVTHWMPLPEPPEVA